ncbi:MAG: alpha/beta hydrolase [Clostridia bacterium]|nr:alpha/beta hydrolase [Clostridia bacterium]
MRSYLDVSYSAIGHTLQKLDIHLPEEGDAFPVFVYFHGGGFERGDKAAEKLTPFYKYMTDHKIAVVTCNYRMYPDAAYPDFIEDGAEAVAWVKAHFSEYAKMDQLFVGGSSAGGHLTMILCFDKRWLGTHGISPMDIDGFLHDAGQPTCHFNMLKERGIDPKRILVDDRAPLYYVGLEEKYPVMRFIVSDNDMKNRYEETLLMISALENFGHVAPKISLKVMHGKHCRYVGAVDENDESVFGRICRDFIEENKK